MTKPRATVKRGGFKPGLVQFLEIDELNIAAWCRDEGAQLPPEQVHLHFTARRLPDYPMLLRFKSPDTLGFLIEELARYRREVWPDAELVKLED